MTRLPDYELQQSKDGFFMSRFIKGARLPPDAFLKNSEKNSELVPGILIGCYRPIQIHLDIHTQYYSVFLQQTLWWKRHNYSAYQKRRC